jgi:hypothetical protein
VRHLTGSRRLFPSPPQTRLDDLCPVIEERRRATHAKKPQVPRERLGSARAHRIIVGWPFLPIVLKSVFTLDLSTLQWRRICADFDISARLRF